MNKYLSYLLLIASTIFATEQSEPLEPIVDSSTHAAEAIAYIKNEHIPVKEFLKGSYAKPGDLWLCSSNSFNSKLIRFASESAFSHMGMFWGNGKDNKIEVIHSDDTPEAKRINPVTGEYWPEKDQGITGVVCHYLDELLYSKDKFVWLPLSEEFRRQNPDVFNKTAMEGIYNTFVGRAYDSSQRYKAIIDFPYLPQCIRRCLINKTEEKQLFCSEFIVAALKNQKLLPGGTIASEFAPEDFLHWNDIELWELDGSAANVQLQKLYDPSKARLIDFSSSN